MRIRCNIIFGVVAVLTTLLYPLFWVYGCFKHRQWIPFILGFGFWQLGTSLAYDAVQAQLKEDGKW